MDKLQVGEYFLAKPPGFVNQKESTADLITGFELCVSTNQEACAASTPIGKTTSLLAFALSYMGIIAYKVSRKKTAK